MSLAPQTQKILDHLQTEGSISGVEAEAIYQCRHLPRRIKDIKEAGYGVKSVWHKDRTGQRYVRYYFRPTRTAADAANLKQEKK